MTAVWLSDHHCRDFNSEISAIFPEFFCFDKKYVSVVYMYVSNGPIGLSSSYSRAKHLQISVPSIPRLILTIPHRISLGHTLLKLADS